MSFYWSSFVITIIAGLGIISIIGFLIFIVIAAARKSHSKD